MTLKPNKEQQYSSENGQVQGREASVQKKFPRDHLNSLETKCKEKSGGQGAQYCTVIFED